LRGNNIIEVREQKVVQQFTIGTDWREEYRRKIITAADAVSGIRSGQRIYIQSHAAAPIPLIDALVGRAGELQQVNIFHLMTLGNADYTKPEYSDAFRVHALFIGANVRSAVNAGRGDYIPVHLSEIPQLFSSRAVPLDVCLLNVSPPDEHGYCSYGISVDCSIAARKAARTVIAQVNPAMPRTMGRSFVHISKLDHIVEAYVPLKELAYDLPDDAETAIGRFVAELVQDRATLQLGIGSIPNAVLANLSNKKDLGVHTEMFSDGVIELIESGVITNDQKTVLPGKTAVSFVMGSKRVYDFVHNNPTIEFQTTDYINDPFVIAQNNRMTAINSALEVDLTGQVGADSLEHSLYSGFGGQLDFIRGAARSKEGRAIIALPSTAKQGKVSRIVPKVSGGVVTTRGDVHYVVTEFGVAYLHGKSLKERAREMINIAHPSFRDELTAYCRSISWLS
jgi:4-hydroxybutyrate CoA-transferase